MSPWLKFLILSALLPTLLFGSLILPARAAVPTLETNPNVLAPLDIISGATTGNLAKRIQEFIFKLTTESLKRSLLNALVSQMVTSIAGGQPKFVTNWNDYLSQNYLLGVNKGLSELNRSGLIGGDYYDSLISSRYTGESPRLGPLSLDEQYQRQRQGFSWSGYLNSWQLENNYYGKTILVDDYIRQRAAAEAEAAKTEALAGGGFLSTKDAAGRITTPGKTIGDTLSRAITSDIDYIVNADDLASFVSAISNSIFNKLVGSGFSGVVGVAGDILGDGALGSFSLNDSSGELFQGDIFENLSGEFESFIFNSSGDSQISQNYQSATPRDIDYSGLEGRINKELENLSALDLTATLGELGGSDINFNLGLSSYRANKEAAADEVERTIWFLDDISRAAALAGVSADVGPLKNTLSGILSQLVADLQNAATIEDNTANRRLSTIERELLRDLYTADLTVSLGNNFDILNELPITLNTHYLGSFDQAESVYRISKTLSGNEVSGQDQEGESPLLTCFNCLFFVNGTQFRSGQTAVGTGDRNYVGLNIPERSSQRDSVAYFNFAPDRLHNYLSALTAKINQYLSQKSALSAASEEAVANAVSRLGRIKELKDALVVAMQELIRAKWYAGDVAALSTQSNIGGIDVYRDLLAMDYYLNHFHNLYQAADQFSLEQADQELALLKPIMTPVGSGGLRNLYTADLGSGATSNQGALPIITSAPIATQSGGVELLTNQNLNVNNNLLPYPYASSNFLNVSAGENGTLFYWLFSRAPGYVSALHDAVAALPQKYSALASFAPTIHFYKETTPRVECSFPQNSLKCTNESFFALSPDPQISPTADKIVLQLERYFYDEDFFGYLGILGNLTNHASAEVILKSSAGNLVLETSRNARPQVREAAFNKGWVYREYVLPSSFLTDLNAGRIQLGCSVSSSFYNHSKQDGLCEFKSIRLNSY